MPTLQAWLQLAVFLAVLLALAWPLGIWLAAVADGRLPGWLKPVLRPFWALVHAAFLMLGRRRGGLVVQHRGQLRHQHQLAGLRR